MIKVLTHVRLCQHFLNDTAISNWNRIVDVAHSILYNYKYVKMNKISAKYMFKD